MGNRVGWDVCMFYTTSNTTGSGTQSDKLAFTHRPEGVGQPARGGDMLSEFKNRMACRSWRREAGGGRCGDKGSVMCILCAHLCMYVYMSCEVF